MSAGSIYVRLLSHEDEEIQIQGSPELVGRFMRAFFQQEDGSLTQFETVFQDPPVPNLPSMVVNGFQDAPADRPAGTAKPDFLTFYRFVSPSNQTEQVLTISYFYQKYEAMESLSLEEYDQAYTILQRIPVEKPGKLKSSVRNVVDRTKYLRNADRGRYMLTLTGEELIERLIAEKQSAS